MEQNPSPPVSNPTPMSPSTKSQLPIFIIVGGIVILVISIVLGFLEFIITTQNLYWQEMPGPRNLPIWLIPLITFSLLPSILTTIFGYYLYTKQKKNKFPSLKEKSLAICALALSALITLATLSFITLSTRPIDPYKIGIGNTSQPTPTPTSTQDPTAKWQTYTSQDLNLSLMHPSEVQVTETIIQQSETDPGTNSIVVEKWGPTQGEGQEYHDALAFNIQVQPLNGKQFDAYASEEVKKITSREIMITNGPNPTTIAGLNGQTFTTSTVIPCNTTILDSKNGNAIVIQDCTQDPTGLGFLNLRDQILYTLKIVTPTSPSSPVKACQMDAKICPDGTSVGRSGPNCEFEPCPPFSNN